MFQLKIKNLFVPFTLIVMLWKVVNIFVILEIKSKLLRQAFKSF